MKQFQWVSHLTGYTHGPYSLHKAVGDYAPGADAHDHLDRLQVGSSWTDRDGDVWTRLPDSPEAELVSETEAVHDERLERIAVAAMVAWIPFTDLLSSRGLTPAQAAMNDARDLIAELDKQA